MIWLIPKWYCGKGGRTPYRALEGSRVIGRILFYAAFALMASPFVYMLCVSDETLSAALTAIHNRINSDVDRFVAVLVLSAIMFGPLFVFTAISPFLRAIRRKRFRGRCHHCGLRVMDTANKCAECGSDLIEQARYLALTTTRPPMWGYSSLRKCPDALRKRWRVAFAFSCAVGLMILTSGGWVYVLDSTGQLRKDGIPQWVFAGCVILGFVSAVVWAQWQVRAWRINLARLTDRCLKCESPMTSDMEGCAHCGEPLVRQQLYIHDQVSKWLFSPVINTKDELRQIIQEMQGQYGVPADRGTE